MSDLTLEELSALVGDDVEFWLGNPFVGRDDIAAKVCRWVSKALAAEKAAREEAEARAVKAEREVIAERKQREWGEKFCAQRHVTKDGRSLR